MKRQATIKAKTACTMYTLEEKQFMFLLNAVSDDREKKAYQAKTLLDQVL